MEHAVSWLVFLSCVASALSGILYPRESEFRDLRSLDGIWQFRAENVSSQGTRNRWYMNRLAETGQTIPMPVPSSYNDVTQDKSLREHVGSVWYDRSFFVPDSWRQNSQRVWLRFGSVHYMARVWLNGKEVMDHEIGHLPFEEEVTSFLLFGQENHITVEVNNTLTPTTVPQGSVQEIPTVNGMKKIQQYPFDFFNYAGIHRPVTLYTTPSVFIDDITIHTDVVATTGIVYFNMTYKGLSQPQTNVKCQVTILDAQSRPVGIDMVNDTSGAGFSGMIEIPQVQLWWPYLMNPNPGYLYTLEARITTIQSGVEIQDVYRLPFGIRTITWNNTTLLINNKPVYMRGFGRHEDSDIRGKGLDLALITKDYNLLKWVGANAYRTSHYPYAEEIMDFADREGIMIIDECPAVDANIFTDALLENHKSSLTQLIQRDKNRPSVILWSIANEPVSQLPKAENYFRSVAAHVKTLDTRRPITAALCQPCETEHAGQFLDIVGFNRYNAWYSDPGKLEVIQPKLEAEAECWHKKHNKPVIMTEYGADTMPGLHLEPSYIWSEEFQADLFAEHFKTFDTLRKKNFFVGEMIWNFADFRTDQDIRRVGGNMKGIFTRERQPKSVAFQVRQRYFDLAHELDGQPLPSNLKRYVAKDEL
uniref:Beta-glucuronidase n=1 Tax=Lygus hesperus TaxID=30085 RepID=A0A0K8SMX2_LYGHE